MKRFVCYNDTGVDQGLLNDFFHQGQDRFVCTAITAQEVVTTDWWKWADMFVIPGGRDLPYVESLKTQAIQIIRDYVMNGGRFLGICAGAYFSSSYVEFDKGGDLEVTGERALRFFPGKAIGPAFPPFFYNSDEGAKILSVHLKEFVSYSYYDGGCFFEVVANNHVDVLATYDNGLPSIVKCRVGNGNALLSGVHFERPLQDPIQEQSRQRLMTALLEKIRE